jgi:hypothetical protein
MAKRLRDVCALPESEPLWRAGRGFVVREIKKRPPFSVFVICFDATGRRPLANLNLIYQGTVICTVSVGAACPASWRR